MTIIAIQSDPNEWTVKFNSDAGCWIIQYKDSLVMGMTFNSQEKADTIHRLARMAYQKGRNDMAKEITDLLKEGGDV